MFAGMRLGHAVLDALRPRLFDAQTIEAAAFHESFGDMSAPAFRVAGAFVPAGALTETGGAINHASACRGKKGHEPNVLGQVLSPRIHGTAWRPPRRLTSCTPVKWAWPHERLVSAAAHPRGQRDGHASVRNHIPLSKPHHVAAGRTGAPIAIGGTVGSASIVMR